MMTEIPLWEKYTLTVEEATSIFALGKTSSENSSAKIKTPDTSCGTGIDTD
jgi:hypothetical protein